MELSSYFEEFLSNTSLTGTQRKVIAREHLALRERLMNDPDLAPLLLATFIQGSQRRHTANRGSKEHPCDVDVVAVTNIPRSPDTAAHAHRIFQPFLERHYKDKYESQDRSWCIKVAEDVTIDLVPTSEPDSRELREKLTAAGLRDWSPLPSETTGSTLVDAAAAAIQLSRQDEDWDKTQPLWIPDRRLRIWEKTHPLYLIGWSARKNIACNGHYIHVVRSLKWWKREIETSPKYPKGYPLEHLVGECCPNRIGSVATGIAETLAEMARRYAADVASGRVPFLRPRGVDDPVNVLARLTAADFAAFHEKVGAAATLARSALDAQTTYESASLWRQLLGAEFPEAPNPGVQPKKLYTQPAAPAVVREGRFG